MFPVSDFYCHINFLQYVLDNEMSIYMKYNTILL